MSQFLVFLLILPLASSQSNYADQANNIEYLGEGLPDQATLDGKVTKLDDLNSVIFLNRTKATLNCAAGSMQVDLKFNDKFYGLAYADFDRNSACQVYGKGGYSYKLELPLKGCGTKQDPQRVFTNNIVVRFHPGLEIDGDEIITIVCRYPPPVAPLPNPLLDFSKEIPAPASILEPALRPFQILLIFCGILFLSLLLLGLGCSYYCLRRRNLTVIRKHPFPSIADSEITKLSGSSLGNLSMFEGLKIPRVNAPVVAAADSSSGSEGLLIPSDYPSESHSEAEDARSLPPSSGGSFENQAYIADNGSYYSEGYGQTQEFIQTTTPLRLPQIIKEPKFDVQMRVKRAPPSPPSLSLSDTESSRTERNLSTILEQREDSVRSLDSPAIERTQFTYVPELHPPPKHIQPAPTYNRILRRQHELQEEPIRIQPARSIASLNTEMTDTHSMTEIIDDSHGKILLPSPIVPNQEYVVNLKSDNLEPPIAIIHKPEITSHVVDDVFLKTITEKKTIEDIERHKRLITEYHTKTKPIEHWDVTIKNYPIDISEPPEWENFSDISSASGMTLTPKLERANLSLPPQNTIDDNKLPLNSPELVGIISQQKTENFLTTFNIPLENPSIPNWNILIRVLQPIENEDNLVIETAETFNSQLTLSDKMKWHQIITTESILRNLLIEAVVREDFEKIRNDLRYQKLFEPLKWDVIIKILTPIEKPKNSNRFRKKTDWDNRSRRSSLPTLYEYDSDDGSIRTLTQEPILHPSIPLESHHRRSHSSLRSEIDLRSMSEMIVDFGRIEDSHSESSSYYHPQRYYDDSEIEMEYKNSSLLHQPSLTRSLSQPSLARSASEFTERWIAPSRYDTASEFTSPEVTPKSQRSSKIQPLHIPRSSVWQATTLQTNQSIQHSALSAEIVKNEFHSEASTSFMETTRKDWFGDNDSEASFK